MRRPPVGMAPSVWGELVAGRRTCGDRSCPDPYCWMNEPVDAPDDDDTADETDMRKAS